ncbi:MAG TPA: patatin-like phospholipase family protein, partial [Thermoleophilaceae bacterium]|nr:patatin-like phospholipase family protein [Thermoleophilaceae bacterium]
MAERGKVGLVLAGGGARGAYEAGVLSELLPELERRGERPQVIVGTSVGAINAAFLGSTAHLGAEQATAEWRERWLELAPERVVRPILRHQAPRTVARYAGEVLGLPGVRLEALLDPEPLGRTLDRWVDWPCLHRNVRARTVDAVAVAATSALRARSAVFVEGRRKRDLRDSQAIDYVSARLDVDLVMASAAIPTVFPAVWVEKPKAVRGWYFDGGTRLNTPIKPALDLGVD